MQQMNERTDIRRYDRSSPLYVQSTSNVQRFIWRGERFNQSLERKYGTSFHSKLAVLVGWEHVDLVFQIDIPRVEVRSTKATSFREWIYNFMCRNQNDVPNGIGYPPELSDIEFNVPVSPTIGLLLHLCRPVFGRRMAADLDSGVCVLKRLIQL